MRNLWVTITEVILVTVVAEILSQSAAAVVDDACSKETGLLTSISGFLNTNEKNYFAVQYLYKVILEFFLVQHSNRRSLNILDKDLIR
jgi:hypothetical protein